MTCSAEVMDLEAMGSPEEALGLTQEVITRWAEEVAPYAPVEDRKMIRLAIKEFVKNVLHGSDPVVEKVPLGDAVLLHGHDHVDKDHLSTDFCGHCGDAIITQVVGAENYHIVVSESGNDYDTYLYLSPIPAS